MQNIDLGTQPYVSEIIDESRDRELRGNASLGNEDLFEIAEKLLTKYALAIKPTSRFQQLKKLSTGASSAHQLVAYQEVGQFLQILEHLGSDKDWHADIQKVFTSDRPIPARDSTHTPARDAQFELYVAARLSRGNISVTKGEPDIICNMDGFKFTVAAKRLKSKESLVARIKDARDQIIKAQLPGIIAVDLSQLHASYFNRTEVSEPEEFQQSAINFLDLEFELQLNRFRKFIQNDCVIGIIAFASTGAMNVNRKTKMLGQIHIGSRLCTPGSEMAQTVREIIDRLQNR